MALGVSLPSSLLRAVQSRQCEFMAGRACVQKAMCLLEAPKVELPQIGSHREPLWPEGYCGSISHSSRCAVAIVVADEKGYFGLDRQEWLSYEIARSISPNVLCAKEYAFSTQFSDYAEFITTVFSAKESLFKAMFPSIKSYVDFFVAQLCFVDWPKGILILEVTQELSCAFYKGKQVEVHFKRYVDDVETRIIDRL
nr:4'-phosphopantetheinyl transferase superfamily protein [uncultured Vibrio sp.]